MKGMKGKQAVEEDMRERERGGVGVMREAGVAGLDLKPSLVFASMQRRAFCLASFRSHYVCTAISHVQCLQQRLKHRCLCA